MSLLRRTAVVAAAVAVVLSGLTAQPAQAAEPDIYTTPGGHTSHDRLWQTECAMYSSTVARCTTNIWSTQVVLKEGQYVNDTGWHFNNLTYLPSARSAWAGNPLAAPGEFTSAGRNWRTECDTPATGRGACRSYIETTFLAKEGSGYAQKTGFVFNNLVRFAEGSVAPVTTLPAHVLDQSTLTVDGLGPLDYTVYPADEQALALRDFLRLGYVVPTAVDQCDAYDNGPELVKRGISIVDLADVAVSKPGISTDRGAEVGMTIGEIKALYGADFVQLTKQNHGERQYFGSVRVGDRELQFRVAGEPYPNDGGPRYAPLFPLQDTDVVVEISAQRYTDDVSFGGC